MRQDWGKVKGEEDERKNEDERNKRRGDREDRQEEENETGGGGGGVFRLRYILLIDKSTCIFVYHLAWTIYFYFIFNF